MYLIVLVRTTAKMMNLIMHIISKRLTYCALDATNMSIITTDTNLFISSVNVKNDTLLLVSEADYFIASVNVKQTVLLIECLY